MIRSYPESRFLDFPGSFFYFAERKKPFHEIILEWLHVSSIIHFYRFLDFP